MSVEDITNYVRVSDRIASSGQPEDIQFNDISKAGYTVVINLAMPDSAQANPRESSIVASLDMLYVHIPVPFDAPDATHLRKFIKTMAAYSDQKVWVHCVLNYRVSAFLYQYQRIAQGVPPEEAKKVMLASWEPDNVWKNFMQLSAEDVGT